MTRQIVDSFGAGAVYFPGREFFYTHGYFFI
jgi:hypothetical protein